MSSDQNHTWLDYRGDYPVILIEDYFIGHEIRILLKEQPGFNGMSWFQVLLTLLITACQLQLPGLSDVCLVGMLSMRATRVGHKVSSKSPSRQGFLASGS